MMLAYGLGRIGCHVAGDGDWGIRSYLANKPGFFPDWAWSYRYPHNVNEMDPNILIPGCEGKYCNQLEFGVYPTALYEVIICLILFGIIWSVRKKFKIPGTLFAFYLMLNGIERFFIEKIRVNTRIPIFGLYPTQAEVISSLLFLSGLIIWIVLVRRAKKQQIST